MGTWRVPGGYPTWRAPDLALMLFTPQRHWNPLLRNNKVWTNLNLFICNYDDDCGGPVATLMHYISLRSELWSIQINPMTVQRWSSWAINSGPGLPFIRDRQMERIKVITWANTKTKTTAGYFLRVGSIQQFQLQDWWLTTMMLLAIMTMMMVLEFNNNLRGILRALTI